MRRVIPFCARLGSAGLHKNPHKLLYIVIDSSRYRDKDGIFFKPGYLLSPDEIMSNHTVHSKTECSMRCVPKSTCVGFNYKTGSKKYVVNCQLSGKTHQRENGKSEENGEWVFYKVMRKTVSEFLRLKTNKCCYSIISSITKKWIHIYYDVS